MNGNDRIFWYTSIALYTVCCTYRAAVSKQQCWYYQQTCTVLDLQCFDNRSWCHLHVSLALPAVDRLCSVRDIFEYWAGSGSSRSSSSSSSSFSFYVTAAVCQFPPLLLREC